MRHKTGYGIAPEGWLRTRTKERRRLAENPNVAVLLLEAGGNDDVPNVMEAVQWPLHRFSERNCGFLGQPSLYPNGHSIPLAMGKVVSHCPEPVSQS